MSHVYYDGKQKEAWQERGTGPGHPEEKEPAGNINKQTDIYFSLLSARGDNLGDQDILEVVIVRVDIEALSPSLAYLEVGQIWYDTVRASIISNVYSQVHQHQPHIDGSQEGQQDKECFQASHPTLRQMSTGFPSKNIHRRAGEGLLPRWSK